MRIYKDGWVPQRMAVSLLAAVLVAWPIGRCRRGEA